MSDHEAIRHEIRVRKVDDDVYVNLWDLVEHVLAVSEALERSDPLVLALTGHTPARILSGIVDQLITPFDEEVPLTDG